MELSELVVENGKTEMFPKNHGKTKKKQVKQSRRWFFARWKAP